MFGLSQFQGGLFQCKYKSAGGIPSIKIGIFINLISSFLGEKHPSFIQFIFSLMIRTNFGSLDWMIF